MALAKSDGKEVEPEPAKIEVPDIKDAPVREWDKGKQAVMDGRWNQSFIVGLLLSSSIAVLFNHLSYNYTEVPAVDEAGRYIIDMSCAFYF